MIPDARAVKVRLKGANSVRQAAGVTEGIKSPKHNRQQVRQIFRREPRAKHGDTTRTPPLADLTRHGAAGVLHQFDGRRAAGDRQSIGFSHAADIEHRPIQTEPRCRCFFLTPGGFTRRRKSASLRRWKKGYFAFHRRVPRVSATEGNQPRAKPLSKPRNPRADFRVWPSPHHRHFCRAADGAADARTRPPR